MSSINALGLVARRRGSQHNSGVEYVAVQKPLRRLLAFRGRSIHDVVNDPIVKNEVLIYWKVFKLIERRGETLALEKQWNPLGQRVG